MKDFPQLLVYGWTAWKGFVSEISIVHVLGLWLGYHVVLALYNISPFHPLSHFPGPKLASATFLYEAWFDLVKGGRFTNEIKRLHAIYGIVLPCPVIRINPEELHFNDIAFVDEIYASGGRKRDKQTHYLNFVAGPISLAAFSAREHNLHRLRRGALNKFFSRTQIAKLEPTIRLLVEQLCDKMIRLGRREVHLGHESPKLIGNRGSAGRFERGIQLLLRRCCLGDLLWYLANAAPAIGKWFGKDIRLMLEQSNQLLPARIIKAREDYSSGSKTDQPSLFAALIDSSLPEEEKTVHRLSGEGFSMTAAGTETTAWTLSVITFHLLNRPQVLARLTTELEEANALSLSWFELEKLGYLNAVIMEGLRHSYGVAPRSPRIAPDETLTYRGQFKGHNIVYTIPPGTPMGMSSAITNHNEDVFPEPYEFIPERWLGLDESKRRKLENHMTSFSKGSRQCVGMK
ncbi:hypothetical protein N7470_006699 [Penicillium chermesinum]|nr:hypothetical protein N7470_006699 [Penicillium chermesinum]